MTVMEYPRQYEGCPANVTTRNDPSFFEKNVKVNWLELAGQQNVTLMHCEKGGWPMLAFMVAALLLFTKQYNGEEKTLELMHKHAPKELLLP